MQDIPRNELLDKIAAGWKVRRKSWDVGWEVSKNGGSLATPTLLVLLSEDWEGEPPKPKMRHAYCPIVFAFTELAGHGCAFIRRPNWVQGTELYKHKHYTLNAEDILSNDWEVWA
jgi:hypothetical protein